MKLRFSARWRAEGNCRPMAETRDEEITTKDSLPSQEAAFAEDPSAGRARRTVFFIGILVLAGVLLYSIFRSNQVCTSYDTVTEFARSKAGTEHYDAMNGSLVRYSSDGISLTDPSGTVIWNRTYGLSNPVTAVCKPYISVADQGSSNVYIFNTYGQVGAFAASVPIQTVTVTDDGVTGAILSDADNNYVNLYSRQGELLVNIKATLENTGYPIAMALSPDSGRTAVSYLTMKDSKAVSRIVFYDFSGNEDGKVTGTETMDGISPKITFVSNSRAVVFREYGASIYDVSGGVSLVQKIDFKEEARSVFCVNSKLGFIFRNTDGQGKYRLEVYDTSGNKAQTLYFDLDYNEIYATDEEILIYNSSSALVFRTGGKLKFSGEFENQVYMMLPAKELGTYWIVTDDSVSVIQIE